MYPQLQLRCGIRYARKGEGKLQALVGAAIDENGLAGDEGSAFGGEPHNGVGDLVGAADASERGAGTPTGENLFLAPAGTLAIRGSEFFQAVGRGVTRSDVVDGDAVRTIFIGEAAYQSDDSSAR